MRGPPKAFHNQYSRKLLPNGKQLGLTHKDIHEARAIRDAELAEPGISLVGPVVVQTQLDAQLACDGVGAVAHRDLDHPKLVAIGAA